jgi:hypothetical protein
MIQTVDNHGNVIDMLCDYLTEHRAEFELRHELDTGELMLLAQTGLVATKLVVIGPGTPFRRTSLTIELPDTIDTRKLVEILAEGK